jgi:hypothetical protein
MSCKFRVEWWACFTADIAWILFFWPVDSRCRARQRQTSGLSTADVGLPLGILSVWPVDGRRRARQRQTLGLSTADVGLPLRILSVWPVDGRRRATFCNFVCLARWRQTSGPLTADVGPVDGRRQFAVVGLPTNAGVDFVARLITGKTFLSIFILNSFASFNVLWFCWRKEVLKLLFFQGQRGR